MAELLRSSGVRPMCLGTTKNNNPRHPCRLGYATPLVEFDRTFLKISAGIHA